MVKEFINLSDKRKKELQQKVKIIFIVKKQEFEFSFWTMADYVKAFNRGLGSLE